MRNPLNKRYLRELKMDFGKYLVIFLFMIMLISLVSGMLIADNNFKNSYDEGFTKYNIEDGHISFNIEPEQELLAEIEEKAELKFYDAYYYEEKINNTSKKVRIYYDRETVNTECIMSGSMPVNPNEIVLDRMFAVNNDISVGDTILIGENEFTVSGFIALPDYSCLFEKSTDMMFDAINFGVAVVTKESYEATKNNKEVFNYFWKYNEIPGDDVEEYNNSNEFIEILKDVIKEYDLNIVLTQGNLDSVVNIEDYVPRYNNPAINFTGEDMGSDAASFTLFSYIVTVILAFVFAVTISNTIVQEAGTIGTLRASGYTKGELVRHYLVLPVAITIFAAIVGNILGYTVFKDFFVELYYGSYSLATYEDVWNKEAFITTTVVPVLLMFVINLCVLNKKMELSPIQFIKKQLTKNRKKKAIHLSRKIKFMHRFRLRIFFQNIPAYITLFLGILLGGVIIVFGTMFVPLLDDYAEMVKNSEISKYQYVLMEEVETEVLDAEKYCLESLDFLKEGYKKDEISIYGIEENSKYILKEIPEGRVLLSNGLMDKYGLKEGNTLILKNHFTGEEYEFIVAGDYKYDAAMAVFMNRDDFIKKFNKEEGAFTGYFTNTEINDIDEKDILTVITEEELTKLSNQLKVSMGDFMVTFKVFGIIMFLLLMYLMTKQIIEKNLISISMTKILGFNSLEIGAVYLVITSVVVIVSLFLCVPIIDSVLRFIFHSYLYTAMSGYIPYIVSKDCYINMIVLGIVSYILVSIFMMIKINKIPKSEALKNVE